MYNIMHNNNNNIITIIIIIVIIIIKYLLLYVSRLVIPSLKIKGTDRSTFAMYWGTTLNLLVMYPGFLSDSY